MTQESKKLSLLSSQFWNGLGFFVWVQLLASNSVVSSLKRKFLSKQKNNLKSSSSLSLLIFDAPIHSNANNLSFLFIHQISDDKQEELVHLFFFVMGVSLENPIHRMTISYSSNADCSNANCSNGIRGIFLENVLAAH